MRCRSCGRDCENGSELCWSCGPPVKAQPGAPGVRLGRYIIQKRLGSGAMGTVYKAWDERLGRPVAIKIIRSDLAGREDVERFRREAALVAQLDHPGIATVHDFGEEDGVQFMVMKYVDGETLDDRYLGRGAMRADPVEAATVMRDASVAVGFAHAKGIVHRDVKPGNIMVDRDGQVFVVDFGLAKVLAENPSALTRTLCTIGTPAYMSPEQALGHVKEVDTRTDVYGLGATLWTLLVGKPPFGMGATLTVLLSIVTEPPPLLRDLRPEVPGDLALVIERAMAKRKEERYPMALNLAAALNEFVKHAGARPRRAATAR